MATGTIRRIPLPDSALDAGREVFRTYGASTSALRPPPDFLIIGTKRGGTTSAYFHLLEHPQVLPMFPTARYLPKRRDGKGPHYFDTNYHRGDRWYLGHFPSRRTRRRAERRLGGPVVVGEASPYYLYHPLAAQRSAALLPDIRILLFLRNPVWRTYSMWKEQVRNRVEKLDFPAALAAEPRRTDGEEARIVADPSYYSFSHEFQSYRAQSEYVRGLRRWFTYYSRDRIKIFTTEEYSANAGEVCNEAFRFLGLPERPQPAAPVLNSASAPPMGEELHAELVAHFAPHNAALEELIGRPLGW